jgi:cytochrome c-type biogenesis protein CcmH
VKTAFYLAAIAMIALALALLLLPLVRQGRRSGRPRHIFVLALAIAFVLPLSAVGLYVLVGTPAALDGVSAAPDQPPLNIDQALAELRAHLKQQPGDAQAWMLLAQAEVAMHQTEDGRAAYDRVLKLDANNTAAMVGWAEADSMARPDHRIDGRSRELLDRVAQLEPDNQRALWLIGISDFQQGQFAAAATTWRHLQTLLEPGSSVAKAVAEQIAAADERAGEAPAASGSTAAAPGPALQVQVQLAPALASKLTRGDSLFVYARAESGPPMPLAVTRLDASTLPVTVTLTDAMAMAPGMALSSVARVIVGARISRSGQAIAQSGDLEGDAGAVEVDRRTPIGITIDKVHP